MTESEHLYRVLNRLHVHYPQWRFGQLVCNVAMWAKGPTETAAWDVSDSELLGAAEAHLEQLEHDESVRHQTV